MYHVASAPSSPCPRNALTGPLVEETFSFSSEGVRFEYNSSNDTGTY